LKACDLIIALAFAFADAAVIAFDPSDVERIKDIDFINEDPDPRPPSPPSLLFLLFPTTLAAIMTTAIITRVVIVVVVVIIAPDW
jgi:hypothetical protein